MDDAVFRQFLRFLSAKNQRFEDLDDHALVSLGKRYVEESYPGAEKPPDKIAKIMAASDADKRIEAAATNIIGGEDDDVDEACFVKIPESKSQQRKFRIRRSSDQVAFMGFPPPLQRLFETSFVD